MIRDLFYEYIWLADTIYRAGKISFDQINELWKKNPDLSNGEDMDIRTFHRHRQAIESMFDVNIECDKHNGYVYYIENLDDINKGGIRSWLLNTFAVNNLAKESYQLKRRILFEEIPSGQQYLTPIIEAMRDGHEVELTYQGYNRTKPHTIIVHPYCLKVFKQRWYVISYTPESEEIRIYSLDRIKELHITNTKYKYPKDFDGKEYFRYSYGIIVDDTEIEVVDIKVFQDQRNYIRALPLHSTQVEIEKREDYSVFRLTLRPTYDFIQEILSEGPYIEVLSPEWLRAAVIERIDAMRERYND
jgi:hypothetical protein